MCNKKEKGIRPLDGFNCSEHECAGATSNTTGICPALFRGLRRNGISLESKGQQGKSILQVTLRMELQYGRYMSGCI